MVNKLDSLTILMEFDSYRVPFISVFVPNQILLILFYYLDILRISVLTSGKVKHFTTVFWTKMKMQFGWFNKINPYWVIPKSVK